MKPLALVVAQYYAQNSSLERHITSFTRKLSLLDFKIQEYRIDMRPAIGCSSNAASFPFLDFSAYAYGLEQVPPDIPVVVLNDTYFTKHPWRNYTRGLVEVLPLIAQARTACAGGVVMPTQDALLIDKMNPARRHLSTFLLAMNSAGRRLFQSLVDELKKEVSDFGEVWLNKYLRQSHALQFLLDAHFSDIPNPWRWPPLEHGNDPELVQRKKVSVALEYLYSARLLNTGGIILPVNIGGRSWLRGQLEQKLMRPLPFTLRGLVP